MQRHGAGNASDADAEGSLAEYSDSDGEMQYESDGYGTGGTAGGSSGDDDDGRDSDGDLRADVGWMPAHEVSDPPKHVGRSLSWMCSRSVGK